MSATLSFTAPTAHGPQDVTLSYARLGAGEPLLLLHGIGHHRQAWDPVADILATEREVIAVDLPGFGQSAALPPSLPHDLPTTTAVLGAFCAALGLDRPHVAGNSLGGLLALEMGRDGLARSVTALSPAGFWSQAERRYAFGVLTGMRRTARALPLPPGRAHVPYGGRPYRAHQHDLRPPRPSLPPRPWSPRHARSRTPRASPRPCGPGGPCSSPTTSPASP